MTLHSLKSLKEQYEHWDLLYKKTDNINYLVRAQDFFKLYIEAVNNKNLSQKEMATFEEKCSKSTKLRSSDNKANIYHYLKEKNTWTSVREIQNNLNLSQHCVRFSLSYLLSENLIIKREKAKAWYKQTEFKIKPLEG